MSGFIQSLNFIPNFIYTLNIKYKNQNNKLILIDKAMAYGWGMLTLPLKFSHINCIKPPW